MSGNRSLILSVLKQIVDVIGAALPADTEIVLHDLSALPNSIAAISGGVTGRQIGDPATDLVLREAYNLDSRLSDGYETRLPDGRLIRSWTTFISDEDGARVAALCINADTSRWRVARDLIDSVVLFGAPRSRLSPSGDAPNGSGSEAERSNEAFVHDVDELAALLLSNAIRECGVPVNLMKKEHKLNVVAELERHGFFVIRDAIDRAAKALAVSKFTIYNYLNELSGSLPTSK